jgi:hypothetical protein
MVWGEDLRERGLRPVADPGRASVLIVPERVPLALSAALLDAWRRMPPDRRFEGVASPWTGLSLRDVLGGHGLEHHGAHGEHGSHGEHGDMMAITGEPSRDGLIMERITIEVGPISAGLPTGLIVSASLDGDIVDECSIVASLHASAGGRDPWAEAAWGAADAFATQAAGASSDSDRGAALMRMERERAVSHLSWLHRYLRLLGLRRRQEQVRAVLRLAVAARDAPGDDAIGALGSARQACGHLAEALRRSRGFAVRNDGVGVVRSDEVGRTGLLGPIARASGSATDRRVNDPVYVALGFEPLTRHEGDARARALLRAEEATQSLELAAALLNGTPAGAGAWEPATRATVEGPRGPVRVTHGECVVLGSDEAMHAAEIAAVGLEWSSALVAIASFDLAPGGLER